MVQHVERRLGLLSGLAVAVLLACAPASAKAPPADAGTSSGKDGGTSAKAAPAPEQKSDGAKASGGGSCSGKATFCGVYGQAFCGSQPGCSYSFATSTCGGLPIQCEKATNAAFCKKIKGCKWK